MAFGEGGEGGEPGISAGILVPHDSHLRLQICFKDFPVGRWNYHHTDFSLAGPVSDGSV